MRILLVSLGNNHKYGGGLFYAFRCRLMNGFIRNGHFVYQFSDSDTTDGALDIRRIGSGLANNPLRGYSANTRNAACRDAATPAAVS